MIPPSLIARYRCYGGDNNAADRNVLKDLSGCGNDITLNGFAWSGESGYGSYAIDFTNIRPNLQDNMSVYEGSHDKVKFSLVKDSSIIGTPLYMTVTDALAQKKFKIRSTHDMLLRNSFGTDSSVIATIPSGETVEVTLPDADSVIFFYLSSNLPAGETVELYQEPYHKGALVFDGVDDYGLCDTFPVLNKEDGFTIIALRKWIGGYTPRKAFLANCETWSSTPDGAFNMEVNGGTCTVFGQSVSVAYVTTFPNNFCVYMTDETYNGEKALTAGTQPATSTLTLGAIMTGGYPTWFPNIALYALEIYSRRLSEDEINRVKDRLMEEYLRETNCLDGLEYVAEWQTYGKTNTDEDRDVLKDLSGNGRDMHLHNFDYTEQSGYNTADYKGALVTDGVDDYMATPAIDDEVGTMLSRLVPFASAGRRYYLEMSNSSTYDAQRLYIWNSVEGTPSISQGVKDDSGYVDNVWPYLSLAREPVSLGGRYLSLSITPGGGSPTSMAFYHLILIRQKCTVEQVECLKWLMDKKYRDYIKNN